MGRIQRPMRSAGTPSKGCGVSRHDRGLVAATPLTVNDLLYAGAQIDGFRAAYQRRNPKAVIHAASRYSAKDGAHDIVVAESLAALDALLSKAPYALRDRLLVLRLTPEEASVEHAGRAGTTVIKQYVDGDGSVLLAAPDGTATASALHVELWSFAPVLLDIRTRLPMAQLNTEPTILAASHKAPFTLPELPAETPKIVISQRPGRYPEAEVRKWLAETLAKGWVPIVETDDHPGLAARPNQQDLDASAWFSVRATMAVQTSTAQLAAAIAPHNPNVKVFANAVFDLPPLDHANRGKRGKRVFYGAAARGGIAVEVARALAPVVRQVPELEFVVVGDRAVFDALPTQRKRFTDYLAYEPYLEVMANCGVTLSPLAGGPYEETKSDAKLLDAGRCGAVLIASPPVYAEVVRPGVNGFIAQDIDDWAPLLTKLLRDEPMRRRIAKQAWEDVRDHRMFADQIAERRAWYQSLWERRADLEAALCERLPGLAEDIRQARAGR